MKVYEALYCPCIHESAFMTLSIHKTKEGAIAAMNKHKEDERKKFKEMKKKLKERYGDCKIKFGEHEAWDTRETKVLE